MIMKKFETENIFFFFRYCQHYIRPINVNFIVVCKWSLGERCGNFFLVFLPYCFEEFKFVKCGSALVIRSTLHFLNFPLHFFALINKSGFHIF